MVVRGAPGELSVPGHPIDARAERARLTAGTPWQAALRLRGRGYLVLCGLLAVLLVLVVYPVGMLLVGTFSTSPPRTLNNVLANLTLDNVVLLATSAVMREAVLTSFIGVFGGAAIALVLALFFAWVVARTDMPHRGLIDAAAVAPLFISPLVAAIAWYMLGSPFAGFFNIALRDLGTSFVFNVSTLGGIMFVLGLYYAPYAYLLLVDTLRNLDPTLEEAAAICGAGSGYTTLRIALPLISHAIYSAILLVVVAMLALYSIPFILGEPGRVYFMTTYLWRLLLQSPPNYQLAAGVGLFLTLVTLAGVGLQQRLLAGRRFSTITGRGYRPRLLRVGRWRYPITVVALLYALIAVVLPYLAVIQAAFRKSLLFVTTADIVALEGFSLDNLAKVASSPVLARSVTNSLLVGFGTALIGLALCFVLAYTIRRTRVPGRALLEAVGTLPVAVPGIVLGVGFLWAWVALPFGFYGTLWILIAAFVARYIPEGMRAISATLVQIHEELEECARVCGASPWRAIRTIILPLGRNGLASAATLLFVLCVREIGPALFLYNSNTTVMSVQVITTWESGDLGAAAALALVQSGLLLIVVTLARRAFRSDVKLA